MKKHLYLCVTFRDGMFEAAVYRAETPVAAREAHVKRLALPCTQRAVYSQALVPPGKKADPARMVASIGLALRSVPL